MSLLRLYATATISAGVRSSGLALSFMSPAKFPSFCQRMIRLAATSQGSIHNRLAEECLAAILTGLDSDGTPLLHSFPSSLFTIGRVWVGNNSQR